MYMSVAVLFITGQNKKQPTNQNTITETGAQKHTPKCSCLYIKSVEEAGVRIKEIGNFTQYISVHFNFYTENEFIHCVILLNPGIRTPIKKKKSVFIYFWLRRVFVALWAFPSCGLSLAVQSRGCSSYNVQASPCGGFSCRRAWALGAQASLVVGRRLKGSLACGIFLDQGSNPSFLHRHVNPLPLSHPES